MPPMQPLVFAGWKPSGGQKLMLSALLATMYALRSLATTWSKDDTDGDGERDTFPYNPNSAVMSTEICKLVVAGMLYNQRASRAKRVPRPAACKAPAEDVDGGGEADEGMVEADKHTARLDDSHKTTIDVSTILKFAIPAFLYMCSNNCNYLALRYLDTPTYQVLGNCGIPIVAVVQRVALRSKKTIYQWIGVATLTLGGMVIGAGRLGTAGEGKEYDRLLTGLFFLLMLELISGCSGVYTEFLLKNVDVDINVQNCMLYTWGVLFTLTGNFFAPSGGEFGGGAFFTGFDFRTVVVVLCNALLGQVVSRVMKYIDNVAKFFCAPIGMIMVNIVSALFFNFKVTLLFSLGSLLVFVASSLYVLPSAVLEKHV